jgi:hypothetical protein
MENWAETRRLHQRMPIKVIARQPGVCDGTYRRRRRPERGALPPREHDRAVRDA